MRTTALKQGLEKNSLATIERRLPAARKMDSLFLESGLGGTQQHPLHMLRALSVVGKGRTLPPQSQARGQAGRGHTKTLIPKAEVVVAILTSLGCISLTLSPNLH